MNEYESLPVPTIDLWKILKRFPLPFDEDGNPAPGSEDLHAAHAAAHAWLARVELELGCPSYVDSAELSEFDPVRRQYGLCPDCRKNDGYLFVKDRFWSFCHRHEVRWEVDEGAIQDGFVVFGDEQWEDEERPVGKYRRVIPLTVAKREPPPEPIPMPIKAVDGSESPSRPELRLVRRQQPEDAQNLQDTEQYGGFLSAVITMVYLLFVLIPGDYLRELWQSWSYGEEELELDRKFLNSLR